MFSFAFGFVAGAVATVAFPRVSAFAAAIVARFRK